MLTYIPYHHHRQWDLSLSSCWVYLETTIFLPLVWFPLTLQVCSPASSYTCIFSWLLGMHSGGSHYISNNFFFPCVLGCHISSQHTNSSPKVTHKLFPKASSYYFGAEGRLATLLPGVSFHALSAEQSFLVFRFFSAFLHCKLFSTQVMEMNSIFKAA